MQVVQGEGWGSRLDKRELLMDTHTIPHTILRNHRLPEMYVGVPPVKLVDSGSSFLERRSPKPVESPLPVSSPMAVENLISPRK